MLKCGCATADVSGWLATWQEGSAPTFNLIVQLSLMLGRWLPDFFQHIPYQLVVFPAGKQLYFFADVNKTLL